MLAVPLSPREGRMEGRRASKGLSGLCFNDDASGRGGFSAAGKWWQPGCKRRQVSGLGWRRGTALQSLQWPGLLSREPRAAGSTAFPLCAREARKARSYFEDELGESFCWPRGRLEHGRAAGPPSCRVWDCLSSGREGTFCSHQHGGRGQDSWREAAWRQGLLCGPLFRQRNDGGGLPSLGIPNAVLA